jgi:hypothetical protein
MIIDLEKLKASMGEYYAEKAHKIDANYKDDRTAIRLLTNIETQELELLEMMNKIEEKAVEVTNFFKDDPRSKGIIINKPKRKTHEQRRRGKKA